MVQPVPSHRSARVTNPGLLLVKNPPTAVQDEDDAHETPRKMVNGFDPGGTAAVSRVQRGAAAAPCAAASITTAADAPATNTRSKREAMRVSPPAVMTRPTWVRGLAA